MFSFIQVHGKIAHISIDICCDKLYFIFSSNHYNSQFGIVSVFYRLGYFGAPESLQIVTAAMKLKDAYSLEEKL